MKKVRVGGSNLRSSDGHVLNLHKRDAEERESLHIMNIVRGGPRNDASNSTMAPVCAYHSCVPVRP